MDKDNFLEVEYKECFEQIRFVDKMHFDLLRYAVTLSALFGVMLSGIFSFYHDNIALFFQVQSFLSAIFTMTLFLISIAMLQNRVHFAFPARQINAIRARSIKGIAGFKNQMYTNPNFSAVKVFSSHSIMIFLIYIINSMYAASICSYALHTGKMSLLGVYLVAIAAFFLQVAFLVIYAKVKKGITADGSVR